MLPQKQRENTSCTFLGPNLPDVWVLSENTSPHTLTTGSSQSVDDGHSATILEGTSIATEIKLKVAEEISRMKSEIGKFPKLVVVLVGDRRDSHRFIDIKLEACEKVGIETVVSELPENCTQKELLDVVSSFNDDKDVHGIVVQLPLPQDPSNEEFQSTGDVCFEEAVKVASAITPVPGGIGPVTIAMLLSNTLDSAKRAFGMF